MILKYQKVCIMKYQNNFQSILKTTPNQCYKKELIHHVEHYLHTKSDV